MEDYINSIIVKINGQLIIFTKNNLTIEFVNNNNYIFLQNIPQDLFNEIKNNSNNIYIINTEQLSVENYRNNLINNINEKINLIDYNYSNFNYYHLINFKKKYFLPYQINLEEIVDKKKIKNVCLIGDYFTHYIPPYRQNIIDQLKKKNIDVDIIEGFGKVRDEKLFTYKIILNISYYENYSIFESIRCDRCVFNKIIVVSNLKENYDEYYLKDNIIFEKYENIPDKVEEILNNYLYYYDKLFNNLDLENISSTLSDQSKELIETLLIE